MKRKRVKFELASFDEAAELRKSQCFHCHAEVTHGKTVLGDGYCNKACGRISAASDMLRGLVSRVDPKEFLKMVEASDLPDE